MERLTYKAPDSEMVWFKDKERLFEPCETLSGGYPASCRNHPGCDGCMATSTRIHWHPSIHMPKEAARIWFKVTDVRVERLQNIDYTALYEQNADFKRYVDRYCVKHRISVEQALQHYLVQMAGMQYKEQSETTVK